MNKVTSRLKILVYANIINILLLPIKGYFIQKDFFLFLKQEPVLVNLLMEIFSSIAISIILFPIFILLKRAKLLSSVKPLDILLTYFVLQALLFIFWEYLFLVILIS
ncbi:hypothetical protein COV24_02335 [candidate division WWE3 bacterium CG10_big_fil_rev_8_21_14_0_10_32_10]|uniref:Uncharacterized protein n=1 Tax=candidate division WWE3 bacterium CG10_big_fil_rev_8_21_14_0_10_32_10 TaxID=1975090 RepID=A0A2H0RAZ5_UNCKA|nr:MAG: hypothetical protein COV24_02335 [candidate division WWE3 bacterium CG10_big_fil_rev_8_21_14_0_10_32_10]